MDSGIIINDLRLKVSFSYNSMSAGAPQGTTCRTLGQLIPIPNATVQITMRNELSV